MKDKNKRITITEFELKKIKHQVQLETLKQSILMFLAWLKDSESVKNDPVRLCSEYHRFEMWIESINEHLITLHDIQGIIENDTGCKIKFLEDGTLQIGYELPEEVE